MQDYPFPELESDEEAIAAFVLQENARTETALSGPQRAEDETALRAILEAPGQVRRIARHGRYIYTFRQTAEHPRGLWLRLPEMASVTHDAPWETVFDLDAFCAESGKVWVWRGAQMSPFNAG